MRGRRAIEITEELLTSWFSTGGGFSATRTIEGLPSDARLVAATLKPDSPPRLRLIWESEQWSLQEPVPTINLLFRTGQ